MNKIFITGATGVLGRRVISLLKNTDIGIVALSRNEENSRYLKEQNIIPFEGDLFNQEDLKKGMESCDAVLHLATKIPDKDMPDKKEYWFENDRIRTEGTENLLKAAAYNGISKFIQQSVVFIYGDKNGESVNESTSIPEEQITMLRSAVKMERLIREYKGIDYVIARFSKFYSEDSVDTQRLINSIKKRKMPIIGKGDFYWNFIHVDDAAAAILYCIKNFDSVKNKTVNFSDYHPIKYLDLIYGIAELTNSPKPFKIPDFMARLILKKDIYKYLVSSYKIEKTNVAKLWEPKHKNFLEGMKGII